MAEKVPQTSPQASNPITSGEEVPEVDLTVAIDSENGDTSKNETKNERIDTAALNGLRGVLALHIMVFHTFIYNDTFYVSLTGSVDLSFFFLISGFVLALNDGKKQYKLFKCCCCNDYKNNNEREKDKDLESFDCLNFIQRRAARVLPMYFLTSIVVIPLIYVGYAWAVSYVKYAYIAYISSFSLMGTWFVIGVHQLLNGPAWFVCTIWCLYLFFPYILTKFQILLRHNIKTKHELFNEINTYYLLNIILPVILLGSVYFNDGIFYGWQLSTFTPLSRFPIFIMGVISGILRLENYDLMVNSNSVNNKNDKNNKNATDGNTNDSGKTETTTVKTGKVVINYSKEVNNLSVIFIGLYFLGCIIDTMTYLPVFNFWGQICLAKYFLNYIYALTKLTNEEKKLNKTYKFLTNKIILWFGEISYAIYLLHMVIMQWINFIVSGKQTPPDEDCDWDNEDEECYDEWSEFNYNRTLKAWAIPIVWIVTIILSYILYKIYEVPMRKLLRPKRK